MKAIDSVFSVVRIRCLDEMWICSFGVVLRAHLPHTRKTAEENKLTDGFSPAVRLSSFYFVVRCAQHQFTASSDLFLFWHST